MKTTFLILAFVVCATIARADDLRLSQTQRPHPAPRKVAPAKPSEGSVQRAAHNGNVLQLINPFAPKEYGDGSEFVSYEEEHTSQTKTAGRRVGGGLKLFGFSF